MKASSLQRLQALRMDNTATGYRMEEMRGRFAALAGRHEDGTAPKAITAFNLFQTPEPIAQRMAEIIRDHCGDAPRILEPSAGLGRIYRALIAVIPDCRVSLVEQSANCAGELYKQARDVDRLFQRDFMETHPEEIGTFDAVCMNPPFKMGADIRHIRHAMEFLKPGGLLVSLCYDGTRQNEKLKPLCDSWEVLPEKSFAAEGTGASVVLLTIRKP